MPDHSTFQRFSDSMHCNYYLEVCSLVFLVAITIAYFTRKKFPVATARLFGVGLISLCVNVGLDVLFCVLLDHSDVVPICWVECVAELFFVMQFLLSYLLFAFVFYSVGKSLRYSPLWFSSIKLTVLFTAVWVTVVIFFLTKLKPFIKFFFIFYFYFF